MDSSCEHDKHRERVRKRFLENGLDGFEYHEALEMYLYYALPRKDTNPLAHRLIDSFGSFSAVFDSPVDVLISTGISENTAVLLKLLPELSRLYLEDKHNSHHKIIDFSRLGDYILNKFTGREYECCVLLLTDAKGKELFNGVVAKGSLTATDLPARQIVDYAMRYHARNAVIAHNHPSGVALPSSEDIEATLNLARVLKTVGVNLVDHLIVADNDYIALSQSGGAAALILAGGDG